MNENKGGILSKGNKSLYKTGRIMKEKRFMKKSNQKDLNITGPLA